MLVTEEQTKKMMLLCDFDPTNATGAKTKPADNYCRGSSLAIDIKWWKIFNKACLLCLDLV